ncbi:TPA: MFS transporter, partial [Candidatus Bathyarchaeota archaeon]|nr:MFS transporter [Candidatus Bathyarchaeota archaeon]
MERFRGLFIASGFFFIVWQALSPILPIYAVELGASITQVGLIMATLSLTLIFTRVPLGILWRGVEPKVSMAFSYGAQLASLLLYFLAPNPVWLFPTMVLLGLGLASFGPLATSTALNLAAEGTRGETAGKFYTSIALAMLSGPFLTAGLLKFLSYKQVFLSLLAFPLAGLASLTKLGGLRRGAGGAVKRFAAASRNLLFALLATVSFFVATGVFDTLFPVYATSALLFSPATVSLLFGVRGGLNALARVPSGKLSDRVGRRKPLILAYLLAFLALLSLLKAGSPGPLFLSMALYGCAWG